MSAGLEVGTDALRRHAAEVEALADSAGVGVDAARRLTLTGPAFGRLCSFVGGALAPVQEAGVTSTSLAVGSLGATAASLRAAALVIDEVDEVVADTMHRIRG